MSGLPEGVRPWRPEEAARLREGQLKVSDITDWEIDTYGTTDEVGKPLRRVRRKVSQASAKKAAARRRTLIAEKGDDGTRNQHFR